MNNVEFMQLIGTLRDLDHHQRKRLSASLNQVGDEAKVFDLIEACFEANSVCPHCANADLHRYGCAGGLQRYRCQQCHKTFNALTGNAAGTASRQAKMADLLGCDEATTDRTPSCRRHRHPPQHQFPLATLVLKLDRPRLSAPTTRHYRSR